MELASMLAGERFSDKPRSVSPVIGSFLRVYNDCLDDDRRQDLYPYAACIVGTRAPRAVEHSRARHCADWIRQLGVGLPPLARLRIKQVAPRIAAQYAAGPPADTNHMRALRLIDELISFSDSWAGVPSDPGELVGPTRAALSGEARSSIEGAGGDLRGGGAHDSPRDGVGLAPHIHPPLRD